VPFTTATLRFFRGLARNNRKPWFDAHRAEFDGVVVAPMHELIEEMDVRLARFAPEIVGDPKRSMFRIYRDIRFSKDKSPYKTHTACWFYHKDGTRAVAGKRRGAEPASISTSRRGLASRWRDVDAAEGGAAQPARRHRRGSPAVRAHGDDGRGAAAVRRAGRGRDVETSAARLRAGPPRGALAAAAVVHAGRELRDTQATSARLPALLEADFRLILPLVRWINGVLGLKPAERR